MTEFMITLICVFCFVFGLVVGLVLRVEDASR
jgi:hypothetical protein